MYKKIVIITTPLIILIPVLLFIIYSAKPASSLGSDPGPYLDTANINTYQGDGGVYALLQVGSTLYMGGSFGMEAVDTETGQQITWDPGITVDSITPYIYSLAYSNNTLYAGTSNGILAFDTATGTGTLTGWTPNINQDDSNAKIYTLSIIGNTLYFGGVFNSVDTQPRLNLASFDISTPTGTLTDWVADTDGSIFTTKVINGNLYVGGAFTTIQSINQPLIAEIDVNSGNVVSDFNPVFEINNFPYVETIEYYNNKVYVGGSFSTINSNNSFNNIASLDENTGTPDATWRPTLTTTVYALATQSGYLYVGQATGNQGNGTGGDAVGFNLTTGNLNDWAVSDSQPIYAMVAENNALYVGLDGIHNFGKLKQDNNANFAWLPHVPIAEAAGRELADIGGLTGTIYLAEFDAIVAPTPTDTPIPTDTPTPTPAPSSGNSSASPPVCSSQKPGTPTGLTATAGPDSDQITLSWTAPADPVTDYSITYSNDPGVKEWGVVSTGKVTSYVISSLDPTVKYYFWVNAVNGCMPGDPAGYANITSGTLNASGISSSSSSGNLINSTNTSQSIPLNPLPATGPHEVVIVGAAGVVMTIIGAVLMLVL